MPAIGPALSLLFVVASLIGLLADSSDGQTGIGAIAQSALPAIVVIETSTTIGSGVIIDASGVVVTNFHVVENSPSLLIKLSNGDSFDTAEVIDYDENKDIVLLKVQGFDLPYVKMGNSNSVEVGDEVIVMGAPRGFEQSVTRGIVSAIRDSGKGYRLIQTDAAISPGSSGGGMFDAAGDLVGVSVSYIKDAQNINFVIPINYVRGMFSLEPQYSLSEFLAQQTKTASVATTGASVASAPMSLEVLISAFESEYDVEFSYRPDDKSWYVKEDGLFLGVRDMDGVILSQIYEIEDREFSQQQLYEFLELSFMSNYAKVGITDSGKLTVANESPLEGLTIDHFSKVFRALFSLSEEVKLIASNETTQKRSANIESATISIPSHTEKTALSKDSNIQQYPAVHFNNGKFQIRFDPSMWRVDTKNSGAVSNDVQYVANDVWIRIISEEVELSYAAMSGIIVDNARTVDPDATMRSSGYRDVNGKRLLWAHIDAEVNGISVSYYYHIYTGPEGTIQIMGYTTSNIFEVRVDLIEEVAASFVVVP